MRRIYCTGAAISCKERAGKLADECAVVFSFRMIGDTRIECRNANSQRETARFWPPDSDGSGVEPGSPGSIVLDGFLSWLSQRGPHLPSFGISRQTFYRWQRRYDPYDLTTLEGRSHCPRRRRQPTWSFPLEEKVLLLRLQFPRWGKDKLAVLLRRQKLPVSTSMVGRILTQLKQHGRLVDHRAREFRDRAVRYGRVPTPCATPSSTRCLSLATWSRSIRWTCVRSRAWSSNSSPPAT